MHAEAVTMMYDRRHVDLTGSSWCGDPDPGQFDRRIELAGTPA
jgi:hypothetical protein